MFHNKIVRAFLVVLVSFSTLTEAVFATSTELPAGFISQAVQATPTDGTYMLGASEGTFEQRGEALKSSLHVSVSGQSIGRVASIVSDEGQSEGFEFEYREEPIAGACVTLSDESGNILMEKTTDENGVLEFTDLLPGNYIVTQVETDAEHVVNPQERSITLTGNAPQGGGECHIVNARITTEVLIYDREVNTENPVTGTEFGLYAGEDLFTLQGFEIVPNNYLIKRFSSNEIGVAGITMSLVPGHYYVASIKSADGYVEQGHVYPFVVKPGQNGRFIFTCESIPQAKTEEALFLADSETRDEFANQEVGSPIEESSFDGNTFTGNPVEESSFDDTAEPHLANKKESAAVAADSFDPYVVSGLIVSAVLLISTCLHVYATTRQRSPH